MLSDEQLAMRKRLITATDVPVILGLSPWKNPADLQLEKLGDIEPQEPTDAMEFGHDAEPMLLAWAERRLDPEKVRKNNRTIVSRDLPWLGATPDGRIKGKRHGVECKTTGDGRDFGVDGSADVPAMYLAQVQTQMAVTGWELVYMPVLLPVAGRIERRMYTIPRDDEAVAAIIERVADWYDRHIVQREPVTTATPRIEVLARLKRQPNKTVELPVEMLLEAYDARERLREAEEAYELAKARVIHALGDAEAAVCDRYSVTYMERSSKRLDTKALRQAVPEIAEQFTTETKARYFNLKNKEQNSGD